MRRKIIIALCITLLVAEPTKVEASEVFNEYYDTVCSVAGENNIAVPFVLAIIEHESSYNTNAVSTTGDIGLMQINPQWHRSRMRRLSVYDLTDAKSNIMVGCDFLEELFAKYQDPYAVLAYYNMGSDGVKLYNKGIYTNYAVEICERAAEITEEIDMYEKNENNRERLHKLLDYCIDRTEKGNDTFFSYSGHINAICIEKYDGRYDDTKELTFKRAYLDENSILYNFNNQFMREVICEH